MYLFCAIEATDPDHPLTYDKPQSLGHTIEFIDYSGRFKFISECEAALKSI
jgi:hypothetical protein